MTRTALVPFSVDAIADASVANAKLANMANATLKGRNTAGTGVPEDVTLVQLITLLQGQIGGLPLVSRRTSDSSTIASNVTLADDNQITIPVVATGVYRFEYWSLWTAANNVMDVKVGWNVPAGATMQWGGVNNPASNTSGGQWGTGGIASGATVFLGAASSFGSGGATGSFGLLYAGFLTTTGTAGNFIPTWAQNTSDAGTLKALTNSSLWVWRIA